jgi:hypothetical protein
MDLLDLHAGASRPVATDFLNQLAQVLGGPGYLMAVDAVVTVASDPQESLTDVIPAVRAFLIAKPGEDYILFSPQDAAATGLDKAFLPDKLIEIFPIWRRGELLGFVAFAAEKSVIDEAQTSVRLIKTVVRSLFDFDS